MNQQTKTEDLILMIFKTHTGEWLSPKKVRDIACAITGTNIMPRTVTRCITMLTNQCKLVRSKTASAFMVFEG